MRRKIRLFKIILFVLLFALILGTLFFLFSVQKLRRVVFYYPDLYYTTLKKENRWLKLSSEYESEDVVLTKEYLLGPIHYDVRKAGKTLLLRNLFEAFSGGNKILIFDFASGFSDEILSDPEHYEWWIRGLLKTLKENTKVTSLVFLENGKTVRLRLAGFLMQYPVLLNP